MVDSEVSNCEAEMRTRHRAWAESGKSRVEVALECRGGAAGGPCDSVRVPRGAVSVGEVAVQWRIGLPFRH